MSTPMNAPADADPKERAAELLAEGASSHAVSKALGVAPSTVRSWRQRDPEFRARIAELRSEHLAQAYGFAAARHPEVLQRLHAIATDPETEPGVAVRAASAFLEQSRKLAEHVDLHAQIDDLRTKVEAGTKR